MLRRHDVIGTDSSQTWGGSHLGRTLLEGGRYKTMGNNTLRYSLHKPQLLRSLGRKWHQTDVGSFPQILKVSLPLVASTTSHTVMTFTDRMFLAWYSPATIAAAVPASILSFTFICFFMGTGQYVNVIVAQFFGAKHSEDLARSLWQGTYFALVAAFIIMLCTPLGAFIIEHSGHSPEVIAEEQAYFRVLMFGGGLLVMTAVLGSYFSGRSQTKVVMYFSFMGAVLNILFNYILIFGKLGFPAMGIRGAGIATVSASAFVVCAYVILILTGRDRHEYPVTRLIGFDKRIFLKLIRFGAPNGFQFFIDLSTFSVFIFLIGLQGDTMLAASNIVLSVDMLAFMPMVGLGQAIGILVGQCMGRRQPEIAVTVTHKALLMAASYGVLTGILFFSFPQFFIGFFRGEDPASYDAIQMAAIPIFRILPVFLLCDCFANMYSGALGGVGDTRFKMWTMILLSVFLFAPGEVLILGYWKLSAVYGWLHCTLYIFIYGSVLYLRFRQGKWRDIDMIS